MICSIRGILSTGAETTRELVRGSGVISTPSLRPVVINSFSSLVRVMNWSNSCLSALCDVRLSGLVLSAVFNSRASPVALACFNPNTRISETLLTSSVSNCLANSSMRLRSFSPADTTKALMRSSTLIATDGPTVVPVSRYRLWMICDTLVALALAKGNTATLISGLVCSASNRSTRSRTIGKSSVAAPITSEFAIGSAMIVTGCGVWPPGGVVRPVNRRSSIVFNLAAEPLFNGNTSNLFCVTTASASSLLSSSSMIAKLSLPPVTNSVLVRSSGVTVMGTIASGSPNEASATRLDLKNDSRVVARRGADAYFNS